MKTNPLRSIVAVCGAFGLGIALTAAQARDPRTAPAPQAPQGRDAAARTGKAVVAGVITTDEQTPQPIKRAQVSIVALDGAFTRTTYTNEAGRFTMTGLPAGRYNLNVTKAPYLRVAYGAKRPDRPGTPITLKEAEQLTSVAMRMTRGAVVSGTITDENGLPAVGVPVQAMRVAMQNGERTFQPGVAPGAQASDMTDDRGVYRFYGLPPGDYVVSAQPRSINGEIKAMTESEIRSIMAALQQQQAAAAQSQMPGMTNAPAPQPSAPPAEPPVTVGYANVYFPGTTTASTAGTISIESGAERAGVDFALRLVRTARIEGTVVVPAGMRPQSVQLSLSPVGGSMLDMISFNRATPGPDGRFTFTAVPPGQYQIVARGTVGSGAMPGPPPPPPPPGAAGTMQTFTAVRAIGAGAGGGEPMVIMSDGGPVDPNAQSFWGQTDISVDGTALSGITVPMQPGMTLTGKIQFRGTRLVPETDLSRVRLTMLPASTGNMVRVMAGALPLAVVNPDGTFRINGISPGRYRISGVAPIPMGSGPGLGWTLASVVAKGRDALDFQLDVAPNDELQDVAVTFTDATQEIGGTLQDATGRPAPDYTIIVFAESNQFWTTPSRRIRSTRPGTDGRFTVTNLPPGEYRIAAVVDVAPNEINDPSFLEQLVPASIKLTLGEGEKKTQDLRISGGL
jgi:uncharacterized protein (DUF2141 family)